MGTRIRELVVLFVGVFAATFLLSQILWLVDRPTMNRISPTVIAVSQLIRQPPDEHIAMPFLAIRVRQIGDSWHERRSGRRKHEGQDIFAHTGTSIYSASEGILMRIATTPKGGNNVSVLGAGGRVYYYAHLSRFAEGICVGEYVTTTTLLGYVGSTGNAVGTPPHLHFGVYDYGGAMNPLPLLANRPRMSNSHHGTVP